MDSCQTKEYSGQAEEA